MNDQLDQSDHAEPTEPTAEQQLAALQSELDETRAALDQAERRHRMDALLIESEVVDLEAARLLTELAVGQMDEPDIDLAVSELRERKPYLFARAPVAGGAMSPRSATRPADSREALATAAATSGDRRTLLKYLRARRRHA